MGSFRMRGGCAGAALLVVLAGAAPPATAAPMCFGERATIYEPNTRWRRGTNEKLKLRKSGVASDQ